MFCKNCGRECKDGIKFCSGCGTYIGGGDEGKESLASGALYESVFIEKDEELLGKMGNGYDDVLFGNSKTKEVGGLLTNKRLYIKGRMAIFATGKKMTKLVITEKVLNLEDLVSVETQFPSVKGYMYSSVVFIASAIVLLFLDFDGTLGTLAVFYLLYGVVVLLIAAFRGKEKQFAIEYTNGKIVFSVGKKHNEEAEGFLRKIHEARAQKGV